MGSIHITALGARNAKGRILGAAYMTITNNGNDAGSGELRVERCQRAMPNSHHDHGQRRDENASRRGRSGNQAGRNGYAETIRFPCDAHGPKQPLEQGKTAEATLQFEKAGTVKVDFPIMAIGAAAPGAPAGGAAT